MKTLYQGLFVAVALAALSAPAWGQRPFQPRTYVPSRPTLSPYLDYFRFNTGVVNNFHAYIRPGRELDQYLRSQGSAIQQNRTQLGTLRQDVTQLGEMRDPGIGPTGHGATFMNHSHFYPSMGGR